MKQNRTLIPTTIWIVICPLHPRVDSRHLQCTANTYASTLHPLLNGIFKRKENSITKIQQICFDSSVTSTLTKHFYLSIYIFFVFWVSWWRIPIPTKPVALAVLHCVDQWDDSFHLSKLCTAQLRPHPYWVSKIPTEFPWHLRL